GPAHIRTRGGCSYDTRRTRFICRSTAGSPDRPVRTGPSHIRTRGRRYFDRHPNRTINTAKLKYATAQLPADKLNNTGLANGVSPAMNRHTTATAINPTVHSTHPVTGGVLKPRWKYNRSITLVDSVPRPPTVIRCSAETAGGLGTLSTSVMLRLYFQRGITLVDSVPRPPTVIRCSAETAGRCPTKA